MSFRTMLRSLALVLAVAVAAPAMAACTDAQAEAKMTQLMDLMGPLMTRNPTLTQAISTEMQPLITQPVTEQTCTAYDRLIARARAGR